MAYEIKDNSGSLFVNDRKESESHPDSKGKAMIGGKLYWVSAWRNESKDGKKYLKLAFTPADTGDQRPETQYPRTRASIGGGKPTGPEVLMESGGIPDDEIPF